MELFGNNKADERLRERKNLDCMLRRDKVGWGRGVQTSTSIRSLSLIIIQAVSIYVIWHLRRGVSACASVCCNVKTKYLPIGNKSMVNGDKYGWCAGLNNENDAEVMQKMAKKWWQTFTPPLPTLYQKHPPQDPEGPEQQYHYRGGQAPVCGQLIKQLSSPEKRITLI